MIKKKAKSKTTTKKSGKRRSAKKEKELNPVEVRKDIAQMVKSAATSMTQAVIDEGEKGQLATVKYLFEMASIYPPLTDGSYATADEDCLAQTLLHGLDIPDKPIALDEEDEPATSGKKAAEEKPDEKEADGQTSAPESLESETAGRANKVVLLWCECEGTHLALKSPLLAKSARSGAPGGLVRSEIQNPVMP